MNFDKQNIVITGASRGLGKNLAIKFSQAGANVILMARSEKELQNNIQEIKELGGSASYIVCDVMNQESVQQAYTQLKARIDAIDIFINNAGVLSDAGFSNANYEDFQKIMEVNVNGAMRVLLAFLPIIGRPFSGNRLEKIQKKAQKNKKPEIKFPTKEGMVVQIASMAGYVVLQNMEFYAISKYAARGIAEALHRHFYSEGETEMKVLTVNPGPFDSSLWQGDKAKSWTQRMKVQGLFPSVEKISEWTMSAIKNKKREVFLGKMAHLTHFGVFWMPKVIDIFEKTQLR